MYKKLLVLFFILFAESSLAVIIKSLDFETLYEKSNKVFVATVIGIDKKKKDSKLIEYDEISFKILESYKNSVSGQVITVNQVRSDQKFKKLYLKLLPVPRYKMNQTVLMFLSKKSHLGYQMPIGFSQGSIDVLLNPSDIKKSKLLLKPENKNFLKPENVSNIFLKRNINNILKDKTQPTLQLISELIMESK